MKKRLIFGLMALALTSLKAQTIDVGFVAVGGGFSDPNDKPRLIAIDLENKEIIGSDTLSSSSLQDLEYDGTDNTFGELYLAAQDSIVKYQFGFSSFGFDLERVEQTYFPRIGKVDVAGDVLFAGRFFGAGPYLFAFDKFNMNDTLYVSENINSKYQDLIEVNEETVAVAYNIKGTIDACAPFSCFADSIAVVEIINTSNWEVTTLTLGEAKAGILSLAKVSDDLFVVNAAKDSSLNFFQTSGALIADRTSSGITELLSENNVDSQFNVRLGDSLGIVEFTLTPGNVVSSTTKLVGASSKNYVNDEDAVGTSYYGLNTDFASFGNLVINTTSTSDTIPVGVSPEDFVVQSFLVSGLNDFYSSNNYTETYLADNLAGLEFSNFALVDVFGNLYGNYDEIEEVDFNSLTSGVFILKGKRGKTIKVIKR